VKAVWSLWTKPLSQGKHPGWLTEKHHLLSWILSFETARRHYPDTCLVTDDEGARLLVEGLGLEFTEVSLQLNSCTDSDPDWWALGKLQTYATQTAPFVHIDDDVYLWQPLPEGLENAQVFAQHPERLAFGASFYRPELLEHLVYSSGGWLPREFSCYVHLWGSLRAENCGIMGGCRTDFINYYGQLGLDLINHPQNQAIWEGLENKHEHFILFEQYLLAACIEYQKISDHSRYHNIEIRYLFRSYSDALANASSQGFTHLLAGAKRNCQVLDRLEETVKKRYPARYERCLLLTNSASSSQGPLHSMED
jgi:hypothetical protein